MVKLIMYSDIQKLKKLGYKKLKAAKQLGIDPKTVRKYWDMTENDYVQTLIDSKERTRVMNDYHDYVLDRLKEYPEITSSIIYDNLREDFTDFSPSGRSVRLYVAFLREQEGIPVPAKLRQYGENPDLPFGYQAQVDMGQKVMKDEHGKSVKVYIFAMVLSSSRYKYVCFQTEPFTAKTFVEAHDRAFRFYGGRPSEIVYDQDRVMVVSENGGDIIYTECFDNYRNYAGFSVHLCRGSDPESKGKIEAVVKYVKGNFLSCRVFHGTARLNSDGLTWLERTGNGLVHETTKMVPSVVFSEEQKYLKDVPELSESFELPKTAIIRKTNVVMYKQNRYSVPKGTYQPGRKVKIKTNEKTGTISFYDLNENSLIEEHKLHHGIGQYVRNTHEDRDRNIRLKTLKDKVLAKFEGNFSTTEYVKRVMELKPRYVRDQLGIILKLQEKYSNMEMQTGIEYCLKRELFSANDLKDTLEYFSYQQPEPIVRKIAIPVKYKVVIAQERAIDVYTQIYKEVRTDE